MNKRAIIWTVFAVAFGILCFVLSRAATKSENEMEQRSQRIADDMKRMRGN